MYDIHIVPNTLIKCNWKKFLIYTSLYIFVKFILHMFCKRLAYTLHIHCIS